MSSYTPSLILEPEAYRSIGAFPTRMFVSSPSRFEFLPSPSPPAALPFGNAETSIQQRKLAMSSPSYYQRIPSPINGAPIVSPGPWDRRMVANFPGEECLPSIELPTASSPRNTPRSNKQNHRNRKSVRFSLQPPEVFEVPNDDSEPRQWLKPEDLDQRRNMDREIVNQVPGEYEASILFLLKSFKAEHYIGRQQLLHHVQVLLKHPEARGLEHRIVNLLKRQRIKAVHQLLRHQQQNSRDLKLRQASLKLSRGARQLAFRLAQSDRLAAKAIHEEL